MHVKIEARIPIFPGTDFHFPSTSVPPGTFLGSAVACTDGAAEAAEDQETSDRLHPLHHRLHEEQRQELPRRPAGHLGR